MSTKQELIDKQPRFWELLAGGSTLTAACEAVRVRRRGFPDPEQAWLVPTRPTEPRLVKDA